MTKFLRVALHEYRQHVFNRRFVLGLLSVPFVMAALLGLVLVMISMQIDDTPIGYIDRSGLLADPLPAPLPGAPDRPIEMIAFDSEQAAGEALQAGTIQAYYVLGEDFRTTGAVRRVHITEVKAAARQQFSEFLAVNLLRTLEPAVVQRLIAGPELTIQSPDGRRSLGEDNWFSFMLPVLTGIGFVVAMFSSGGYLMQAVVEEKENRTMEVIITSVSPNQFMSGKIVADIAIGLTQLLVWAAFIVVPILLLRSTFSFLQDVRLSGQTLLVMAFTLLPAFVMVAALMAAIGATVTEAREGQQLVSMISLPVWIPYMLTAVLMQSPNSPLAIALSLLPLTAPITMLLRDGLTVLPAWQLALCALVQLAGAAASIWLAGRAFRLGMLRYGKRLSWRELLAPRGGRA